MSEHVDPELRSLRAHIDKELRTLTDEPADVRARAGRQRRERAVTVAAGVLALILVASAVLSQGRLQGAEQSRLGAVGPGAGAGSVPPGTEAAPDREPAPSGTAAVDPGATSTAPPESATSTSTSVSGMATTTTTIGGVIPAGPLPVLPPGYVAPITTAMPSPKSWAPEYRDPSGAWPCGTSELESRQNSGAPDLSPRRLWFELTNISSAPCWVEGFPTIILRDYERTVRIETTHTGTGGARVIIPPRGTARVEYQHDVSRRTAANCPNPWPIRYYTISSGLFWAFDGFSGFQDGGPGSNSGYCSTDRFTSGPLYAG